MNRKSIMKKEEKWVNRRMVGFTLVELIVVLVILSVLSAVAVPTVLGFIDEGKAKECKARVEALAVDVASAKMSAEVNGIDVEAGEEISDFDVQSYINDAGGNGECPLGDTYTYVAESNEIRCAKHDVTIGLPNSGKFSVVVAESERESEIKVEPPKTPESSETPESPDNSTEPSTEPPTEKEHSYTFEITPDPGVSLEDMEAGASAGLTVQVYEDGEPVPEERVTVEWHFPDCVSGTGNKTSATVEAGQTKGDGSIACTVTVRDEEDATKTHPATGNSVDVSVKGQQLKPRLNNVPDNLKLDKGETNNDLGSASVSDYPGTVKFKYESSDSSGLEVDPTTGEVNARESGTYQVTVTATDEDGNTIVDENGNPLSKTVTVLVPTLYIELTLKPESLSVNEEERKQLTTNAVVKEEETGNTRSDKQVTLSWKSEKEDVVDVDNQGWVTGKKAGSNATVTVTASAEGVDTPAEANAIVEVVKKSGGVLKKSAMLWAEDHGGTSTFNLEKEEFASWFIEQPQGEYGLWEYKGTDGSIKIEQGNSPDVHGQIEWEGGKQYVLTYTPPGGEPEEIVITVGHTIREIGGFATNSTYKVGENIQINPVIQPPNTTDRIQWEINWWEGDKQPVELTVTDDTHISLKAVAPGKFTVRAYAITARHGTLVEKISNQITIEPGDGSSQEQNSGIIGVTLNPSSMTLKEGQSGQLEATLQANDDVDTSKVRYKFYNNNGYVLSTTSSGDTTATVTGLNAGQDTVYAEVYYGDEQQCKATAQCSVTVTSLPSDEVQIDGSFFKARDWTWLKQQVRNNNNKTYHVNMHREEENEDETILFYEEYWDNGIKKRDLYIAKNNSADIEKSDSLNNSGSFKDYLNTSEGKDKFFKVDLEHIVEARYEDLVKDNTIYPCGTIAKIEMSPGVYEYYVAYYPASNKTKLGSIVEAEGKATAQEKRDTCGWWRLNILE